jgi:hypothetical protein
MPSPESDSIHPADFGAEWERLEQITNVDWDSVFANLDQLSPKGFYVRLTIGSEIPYGSSTWARETRYNPALEIAVRDGQLEMGYDENGDPVVRLPIND